ncbi:MAG: hypothetical protein PVJ17_01315 [Lysobacterales bacterium]
MAIHRMVERLRMRDFSTLAIELFVVIIGVFIGIQVSSWNDARLDRIRAHSYLERIRSDLDADILSYQDRLRFWRQVSDYGALGLGYANDGDLKGSQAQDLLLAYFQASQMALFYTTRSTYDELKSGGELGLIRDLELRKQLAVYYTNADNPVLNERPAYREHLRGLLPLRIQNPIWEECYRSNGDSQTLLDCDPAVDPEEAARLVATISGNSQLMSELRYWMSTMRVARLIGSDRLEFARKLRQMVNSRVEAASAGDGS